LQQLSKIKPRSYSALFLALVAINIALEIFINIISTKITISSTVLLLLSEGAIIIPALVWMLIYNEPIDSIGFRKIKPGTFFITILLAELILPLVTLVNVLSQFFTTNTLVDASDQLYSDNYLIMIFIIGFVGPVCEEVVFRGIIFKGLSKYASIIGSAFVSGLFFGLMHMNLNQFCYAFVMGIIFAIVNYASGSIITSIIIHVVVNTQNILLLFAAKKLMGGLGVDMSGQVAAVSGSDYMYYLAGVYIVLALIFTTASIPVFGFIAEHEGNPKAFSLVGKAPENGGRSWWLNPYSIVACLICGAIIFVPDLVLKLFGM